MPFGLCNSPLTYMKLMNTVLQGLIGSTASVFLDDILIVSKTEEEHFKKLDLVFSRLKGAGLKVKLEKCSFLQDKVIMVFNISLIYLQVFLMISTIFITIILTI